MIVLASTSTASMFFSRTSAGAFSMTRDPSLKTLCPLTCAQVSGHTTCGPTEWRM